MVTLPFGHFRPEIQKIILPLPAPIGPLKQIFSMDVFKKFMRGTPCERS
jgi:hypothetical protein